MATLDADLTLNVSDCTGAYFASSLLLDELFRALADNMFKVSRVRLRVWSWKGSARGMGRPAGVAGHPTIRWYRGIRSPTGRNFPQSCLGRSAMRLLVQECNAFAGAGAQLFFPRELLQ